MPSGGLRFRCHSSFVRVCVVLRKTRWRGLSEYGIRFSPPGPHSSGASSIVGRCVEVCLRWICYWWICSDLIVVRLHSCVFRLDPSDLRYSSSSVVVVLLCWSYGALAWWLPDCLLQQVLPCTSVGGAMTAVHLRLASVLIVVARWYMDLDVIFITSGIRCAAMIEDE